MTANAETTETIEIAAVNRPEWMDGWVRPHYGLHVEVYGGRKHAGKTGYVVLLQRDQFSHDTRYMTDPMKTIWGSMTEKIGRTGFVVMVDPDQPDKDGKRERFYVKAEYIRPIKDGVE